MHFFYYLFDLEIANMGVCISKQKPLHQNNAEKEQQQIFHTVPKVSQLPKHPEFADNYYANDDHSIIKINLRRKTGIFKDISCPIDCEVLQDLDKQLGQFESPMIGLKGNYSEKWQQVTLKQKSGWWYIGEWKNGLMHGKGTLYSKTEQILIHGIFIENQMLKSKCRIIFETGVYYEGSVNQFYEAQGYGVMHFKNGTTYTGQFLSGVPNGDGREKTDNYSFHGNFVNGMKKYGSLKEKNGVYQGQFQNNLKHGEGFYEAKNGKKYRTKYQMNKVIAKQLINNIENKENLAN